MRKLASCLLRLVALAALPLAALPLAAHAGEAAAAQATAEEQKPVDWESWHAGNSVSDLASLQRGARNFMNYCNGCHALKYMRYQRMADDLKIPTAALASRAGGTGQHIPRLHHYLRCQPRMRSTGSARCRRTCR